MLNSKALKPGNKWDKKLALRSAWQKISYFVLSKIFYLPIDFIHVVWERLKRSWAFAKFGYRNYDFDSHMLYGLMSFKLKRIEKCLQNGHAVQEEADMSALKEAIEVLDRLYANDYEDKYYDLHDSKWGPSKHWFTPVEGKEGYSTFHSSRPNANTEEEKAQEIKELLQCMDKGHGDMILDLERLFTIFKNHLPTWWD